MKIRSLTAPNPGPFTLDGTRTYLLGETAVIDPGPEIESHIEAIHRAMPRLQTILITHRHGDHAPAAVPLKERTGARIIAPPDVLEVVDQRVNGGESLVIEETHIAVIATPGHTREHVCYLTDDGDLFTGDTILGSGTTAIFPPDGNMADYLRSLRTLRELEPKRIHPAHGPDRDDAVALIDEYLAHRLERERQVLAAIDAGATTLTELRERIYPRLDARLHRAAEIQMQAHVIKLVEEGRVVGWLMVDG
ncbi:MAG TPA: MBL fold metallo-hydrolase [Thermoanaerobaculia bacterium]|nr:MBL fold metallo-hydrolase [Thermoanaerobaculia bacterium]